MIRALAEASQALQRAHTEALRAGDRELAAEIFNAGNVVAAAIGRVATQGRRAS